MDTLTTLIEWSFSYAVYYVVVVTSVIVVCEDWIRTELGWFGVTPVVQTVLMLMLIAAMILVTPKFSRGLVRVAIILVLVLIAGHVALPMWRVA